MQRKDLALRVLSTAAIMSIVTSIAAPAFADIYYIGNGSIDVETITSTDGKQYVKVTQGDKTYTDTSDEIVIKDGNNEGNAAQKEENRIEGKKAKVAIPDDERTDTQELEATGSADAAGEGQPDPDAAFTLSEEEEDSEEGKDPTDNSTENPTENPTDNPTEKPTENPTDDPTEPPKKDVVYQLDPAADPNPEQQATKLAPTTSATPTAKTKEATLDAAPAADPAPTTPAEGSAKKPTKNVIRVINNWAEKVLNIRLSNVNVKVDDTSRYADGTREQFNSMSYGVSAAEVQGTGKTKIELDGQNVLDSSTSEYGAGLRKKDSGNLTITDETSDKGETITAKEETETSGSLRAEGGIYGGAAIGGNSYEATDNITIEGYATVNANILKNTFGCYGAGIGGGSSAKGSNITIQGHANVTANGGGTGAGIGGGGQDGYRGGDAENITIQDYAKVTATGQSGAAIGGGFGQSKKGNAKNIVIQGHATVDAKGGGAAIGAAWGDNAEVTIGTAGATAEQEDVHVTATSSYGAAIGSGAKDTKVTIQGHVTIQTALGSNSVAIGSRYGNVTVNIKDNASIDTATGGLNSSIGGWSYDIGSNRKDVANEVVVNIDGGTNGKVKLGENSAIIGSDGAISATEVNIGNNVLLKIKQSWQNGKYIAVNNAEAEVGTRSNPAAGGLVNTIGDNTELWYTDYNGVLQKIVHGKNVCAHVPGKVVKKVDATCTEDGWVEYECDYEAQNNATGNSCGRTWKVPIPKKGHTWGEWVEDTTAGTRTHECSVCHARETEALPSDTNSALELRVVDAEGMNQPFTVSQNGTLRTYTGAYDIATLTGDLDTLRYLQDHGAQTIRFVTNGQTSSFDINDLLAQGSGSEVFYLTHRGAEEPTLLLVEADHSELVKD